MGLAGSERQGQGLRGERHTAHTRNTVCNDQRPRDARIHHTAMGKAFMSVPSVGRAADVFWDACEAFRLRFNNYITALLLLGQGLTGKDVVDARTRCWQAFLFLVIAGSRERIFVSTFTLFSLGNDHT
jgi:hypothetical protein